MKNILITTSLWFATLSCIGQIQDNKTIISLNVGPGYLARQDLIFSPFIHTDLSFLNIGIDYTRDAKLFQKAAIHYGNFNAMVAGTYNFVIDGDTNIAYPHSFNLVDIDYLLGKKIKEYGKSSLTAGGLFAVDVQAMNYVYGRVSSFGYYSNLGLGVFGKNRYVINESNSLTLTLQLPLLSWFARSPYLVNDDEFIENISSHSGVKTFASFLGDGQFVSWNKLQTFDFDLKYGYSFNNKWELGAAYMFEFIHAQEPKNLLSYRNTINLSANFKF